MREAEPISLEIAVFLTEQVLAELKGEEGEYISVYNLDLLIEAMVAGFGTGDMWGRFMLCRRRLSCRK